MIHTFGFSNYQFPNFIDSNGNRRSGHITSAKFGGTTHTVLNVPPLTQKLRDFYGCSTLQGAVLENGGSSSTDGSHFERKFFVYETMSSGSIVGRRVSEFSLALLEGSGWYTIDYSFAEPYYFGQGQGCPFVRDSCTSNNAKFNEYCEGSSRGCAPTVEEVVIARVILSRKDVNTTHLTQITIVRMRTVLIMPLSLNYKVSEETSAVNVSVVPFPQSDKTQLSRDLSASSMNVLEVDHLLNLN